MKVLLTNCWQVENTGDSAIWKNMMRRLRESFPDCQFIIASQASTEWDIEQLAEYKPEVVHDELVTNLNGNVVNSLKSEEEIYTYLSLIGKYFATDGLKDADIVISQGGGYMIGNGMWRPLSYLYIAQLLGKPTFFASQTFVGELSAATKLLARAVFNNAKTVIAREGGSYDFITKHVGAAGDHIEILPDAVFDIEPTPYSTTLPEDAVKIGIRGYSAPPGFIEEVARFADMAAETIAPVVFVPVGHGGNRNDIEGAKKIAKMMKYESIVIEDKISANELIDIMKDGILVSDRYHGILCAAMACAPFVPMVPDIGYKMPGLLELIKYPRSKILSPKTTTAEELLEYATDVWENRVEIRDGLKVAIPPARERAGLAYKRIIEKIKEKADTEEIKLDKFLGSFIQCYAGHINNDDLRSKCASGGIITQTMLHLLETKAIDGALVSRMGGALETETFIAKTPEEIISASGSIYYPVPFLKGLEELAKTPGKFAVVGLPCHLKLLKEKYPELQERVVLAVSPLCNHTPSGAATEAFLEARGIKKEDVRALKYRDLAWPGTVTVKTDDKQISVPFSDAWHKELSPRKFWPTDCQSCHYCIPEEADMCCGDSYLSAEVYETLKHVKPSGLGTSLIVCKTKRGLDVLNSMRDKGLLTTEKISPGVFVQAEPHLFRRCGA